MYVTELVAAHTVNTMPEKTMDASPTTARSPETPSPTDRRVQGVFDELEELGIDLVDVFEVLGDDGVDKFEKSWHELLEATQGSAGRRRK